MVGWTIANQLYWYKLWDISRTIHITFNASVTRLQVTTEISNAWKGVAAVGQTVNDWRDSDIASTSTRAPRVELGQHVQLTPKVAVVDGQTPAESHATVVCRYHNDHFVGIATLCRERLTLAVLGYFTRGRHYCKTNTKKSRQCTCNK